MWLFVCHELCDTNNSLDVGQEKKNKEAIIPNLIPTSQKLWPKATIFKTKLQIGQWFEVAVAEGREAHPG